MKRNKVKNMMGVALLAMGMSLGASASNLPSASFNNDPFEEMSKEMDRMINEQVQMRNRMFNNAFPVPFGNMNNAAQTSSISTNVQENNDNYLVEIGLKGFKKEDIKVDLTRGYLVVAASHNEENTKEEKNGDKQSTSKSNFTSRYQQSFYVGDNVTKEDIKAKFENETLKITIPKKEQNEKDITKEAIAIEG